MSGFQVPYKCLLIFIPNKHSIKTQTFLFQITDSYIVKKKAEDDAKSLKLEREKSARQQSALSRGSADVVQDWRMDIGCVEMEEMGRERDGGIHCNGKNNHFRFSLEDFFWKRGKLIFSLFKSESESEKSEKITFQKRK